MRIGTTGNAHKQVLQEESARETYFGSEGGKSGRSCCTILPYSLFCHPGHLHSSARNDCQTSLPPAECASASHEGKEEEETKKKATRSQPGGELSSCLRCEASLVIVFCSATSGWDLQGRTLMTSPLLLCPPSSSSTIPPLHHQHLNGALRRARSAYTQAEHPHQPLRFPP